MLKPADSIGRRTMRSRDSWPLPIVSASRFPGAIASALAVIVTVGVLTGCQRADRDANIVAGETVGAESRDAPILPPVAAPAPPAQSVPGGGLDVSELFVILEAVVTGETAADLLVTDPRGRRTGVEPATFKNLMEIHGAWYDSSPPPTQTDEDPPPRALPKQFQFVTPTPGTYSVAVVGRYPDAYTLIVRIITPRGETREATLHSRIVPGEVHRLGFVYDRAGTGPLAISRP